MDEIELGETARKKRPANWKKPGPVPRSDDNKQAYVLTFRVTGIELVQLTSEHQEITKINKKTFADFLRGKIFADQSHKKKLANSQKLPANEKDGRLNRITEKDLIQLTLVLGTLIKTLSPAAKNLNQITKRLNTIDHKGKLYYEVESLKVEYQTIMNEVERLRNANNELNKWFQ
jgi:hypothetical protein